MEVPHPSPKTERVTYTPGDRVDFIATFDNDLSDDVPDVTATLVHETDSNNVIILNRSQQKLGQRQVRVSGFVPAGALHGRYKVKVITVAQGVFQHELADPDGDGVISVLPGGEHNFPRLIDFDPHR